MYILMDPKYCIRCAKIESDTVIFDKKIHAHVCINCVKNILFRCISCGSSHFIEDVNFKLNAKQCEKCFKIKKNKNKCLNKYFCIGCGLNQSVEDELNDSFKFKHYKNICSDCIYGFYKKCSTCHLILSMDNFWSKKKSCKNKITCEGFRRDQYNKYNMNKKNINKDSTNNKKKLQNKK